MNEPIQGFVLRSVLGAGGGAEKIILRTVPLIDPSQCEIMVCGIHRTGDADYDFGQRCKKLAIDYREVEQKSVFDPLVWSQLRDIFAEKKYDFIHAHDYKAVYYARKLASHFDIPSIATLHGWTGYSWKERFLYYPLERKLLRSFDRVLAVSNQIRDTYINSGGDPKRVHVILNGISPGIFRRNPQEIAKARLQLQVSPDDILLLGLGRLEQQKRFDVLLQTMNLLRSQDKTNFVLVIAGEGSLKEYLQRHIDKYDLGNCCRLIGHCSDAKLLYHAADMLVQSSDYEGTPTVVVEAMAMELPIVATDVGGTAELMHDQVHGRIVPRRNPQALADAINETLNDQQTTSRYVQAARERAEKELSFASRTEQLLSHFQSQVASDNQNPADLRS